MTHVFVIIDQGAIGQPSQRVVFGVFRSREDADRRVAQIRQTSIHVHDFVVIRQDFV